MCKPKRPKIFYCLKTLVVLFFFIISTFCFSQSEELIFQRFTVKDGLSHNNVYTIIQDNDGYMWFGTQDGLDKYDGYKFSIFRHNPNDSNSISTSNFGKIYQDKEGIFWLGTFGGGLDKYNPKTNLFTNYSNIPNNIESLSNNQILFIYKDSKENIWIGTSSGGLNRFNKNSSTFFRFENNPYDPLSLSNNRAKCICETKDGTIWIGTGNGLNKLNSKNGTFQHFKHDNKRNSIGSNNIQHLLVDKEGNIWLALRNEGVNKFNPVTEKFTHYKHDPKNTKSISDNDAEFLFIDSYDQFWVGTYNGGLNKFNPITGEFIRFKYNPNNISSIGNNRIEYIYEDNSHNLWIATRGGGLSKVDLKQKKINTIVHNPNIVNSLSHPNVMCIESDNKDNIWIGTDGGGLSKYNLTTKVFLHFFYNKENSNSLSTNRVWSVCSENDSVLWAGTYLGGLNRIEFQNGQYNIKRYRYNQNDSSSISSDQINTILKDNSGNMWFATSNGLSKLIKASNSSTYSFQRYFYVKKSSHSFVDNYINYIYQDSKNRIWLGSHERGLSLFDPKSERFTYYSAKDSSNSEIKHKLGIVTILEFKEDILLLGTQECGLVEFNIIKSTFSNHPINNHIKSKMVTGIIKDNSNTLWITTGQELLNYDPETNEIFTFKQDDGLISSGFNRNSISKCKEGNIYIGSTSALVYFNPSKIEHNKFKPNVSITDISIASKSIWGENLLSYKKFFNEETVINLDRKDYMISIEFAALDYTSPNENNYKYMLEGIDKNWVDAENRIATYTTLPHGLYTFKVMGSNNDNLWNENPTTFKIKVHPPLWKNSWFLIAEIILLLFLIFCYIRWRTRSLIREKRRLEIKIQERTKKIQKQNEELEKLSIVASKTDNAVYILSPVGDLEWLNDGFAKMHGYSLKEFVEMRGSTNILKFSCNPEIENIIQDCIQNKKSVAYSCLNKTKSGVGLWLQTTITPILDKENNIKKLIAIDSDVSLLKKAEEEILKQVDQLEIENATKNKFFRIIAHDLRNPMGTLVNFSDLILEDFDSIEKADLKTYLDQFNNLSKNTFNLLENLLQWASNKAGRIPFSPENIDITKIISENIELVKAKAESKNIVLKFQTQITNYAYADENMINTVIRNLLSNALKFTPEKGTIEVNCKENKEYIHINVKDSGLGINKEDQKKLFKVDVHHTTLGTSNEKGSGLGLILCKEFVEKNEGTISVESELNKGTSIEFTLKKKIA